MGSKLGRESRVLRTAVPADDQSGQTGVPTTIQIPRLSYLLWVMLAVLCLTQLSLLHWPHLLTIQSSPAAGVSHKKGRAGCVTQEMREGRTGREGGREGRTVRRCHGHRQQFCIQQLMLYKWWSCSCWVLWHLHHLCIPAKTFSSTIFRGRPITARPPGWHGSGVGTGLCYSTVSQGVALSVGVAGQLSPQLY